MVVTFRRTNSFEKKNTLLNGRSVKVQYEKENVKELTEEQISYRIAESKLIKKYDNHSALDRSPIWCMMDANWVQTWLKYIFSKDALISRPGQIKSSAFYMANGDLRKNLEVSKHYIGVTPMVFLIYKEIYGADDNAFLWRRNLDIYSDKIPSNEVDNIVKKFQEDAKSASKSILKREIQHMKVE